MQLVMTFTELVSKGHTRRQNAGHACRVLKRDRACSRNRRGRKWCKRDMERARDERNHIAFQVAVFWSVVRCEVMCVRV